MLGSLVLINSEKREMGKTIIGIKIGIELSNRGKKVMLIDLTDGNKQISEYFNIEEDIIYDVKDVIDETCSIEQAIIDVKDNLSILPFPRLLNKFSNIKKDGLSKLLLSVKEKYDVAIADINQLSTCYYIDFSKAESIIIVNNNDYSSVKEINSVFEIAKKFGLKENIIINKFNRKNAKKGNMLRIKDLNKLLERENLLIIEEELEYMDINYDFLFNNELNSFNNAIDLIANKLSFLDYEQ